MAVVVVVVVGPVGAAAWRYSVDLVADRLGQRVLVQAIRLSFVGSALARSG